MSAGTFQTLRPSAPFWLIAGVAAVLALLGLAGAHHMESAGHWVTGMNNRVVWGLPHVFAVFLIVGASGALNVASVSSVFGQALYKPLSRLSGLLAMALLVGGLSVLVLDLGRPDRLIIATGAVPRPLAGIATAANVRIFQALEILERRTALCGDVVVVGGGLLGMDTAEFLSTGADQVTVLEAGWRVGRSLEWNVRGMRLKALNSYGVRTVEQAALVRLERGRAVYCDQAGVEHTQAADAVVLALGLVPHNPFGETAAGLASGITLIGDCAQPAGITAAISQGRLAGSV